MNIRASLLACIGLVAVGAAVVVWIYSTEPVAEREEAVRESAMLVVVPCLYMALEDLRRLAGPFPERQPAAP